LAGSSSSFSPCFHVQLWRVHALAVTPVAAANAHTERHLQQQQQQRCSLHALSHVAMILHTGHAWWRLLGNALWFNNPLRHCKLRSLEHKKTTAQTMMPTRAALVYLADPQP
jgi:hypothetical protein